MNAEQNRARRARGQYRWRQGSPAGLTLVELLVVLAILGLMAGVAIPSLARMGLFSSDDVGSGSRELFALMRAAKVHAATYRVDTAIAYGVVLKQDSVTGQAVESINAAAMVYRLPDAVRDRCVEIDTGPDPVGPDPMPPRNTDIEVFTPVKNELGGAIFKEFPRNAAIHAELLLPDGAAPEVTASSGLRKTVRAVRVYEIDQIGMKNNKPIYQTRLIAPLRLDEADTALLGSLPLWLQYLAALPVGKKYLEYQPDATDPPLNTTWKDFRFPAHVFTPSGRIEFPVVVERAPLLFGFSPDAAPEERYVDPSAPVRVERNNMAIELYRATGRVKLAPEEG